MFDMIKKIVKYPRLTLKYPAEPMDSSLFLSKPEIDAAKCSLCGKCVSFCPPQAIALDAVHHALQIDYGKCICCVLCEELCPTGAFSISGQFELAVKEKKDLIASTVIIEENMLPEKDEEQIGRKLQAKVKRIFGRSLHIREVDAGSCNGCDYEINALNNPFNDIERFGIHFVASPRHADMLLVTGTGTRNMQQALLKTYQAAPDPKLVVAVGACACSGGIFRDSYAVNNGIDTLVPVDVYIPGCPPRPQAILYGILKALDRI